MPWHVTDVIIFHLGLFFTLLPPNYPKNQNFKKEKKTPRDIYIYIYTIPESEIQHMTDVIVTFHFGLFFVPLPP